MLVLIMGNHALQKTFPLHLPRKSARGGLNLSDSIPSKEASTCQGCYGMEGGSRCFYTCVWMVVLTIFHGMIMMRLSCLSSSANCQSLFPFTYYIVNTDVQSIFPMARAHAIHYGAGQ
jgi:hypothetical protein